MTHDYAVAERKLSLNGSLLAPFVLVSLCGFAALAFWGVRPGDIVRFALFEILLVLAPGWLLYKALMPAVRGVLRPLSAGWALGYILLSVAYRVAAATGHRDAFILYPPLVLAILAPWAWYRCGRPQLKLHPRTPLAAWGLPLLCIAIIVNIGLGYFPGNPLPGTVPAISYSTDTPWHIGNAAEARWHWPITDPRVSGEPFPYYTFVYLYLAAANQITGIALPVLVLRFYFLHFSLLNALQLYTLGRILGRRHVVGFLVAAGILFIGEVDPFPTITTAFETYFINSPTTFLGMLLFVPLLLELSERLVQPSKWIEWMPVALLLIGSGGAKAALLPVIGGGLALFLLSELWLERRVNWSAAAALAFSIGCYLFFSNFAYGEISVRVALKPLDALKTSQFVNWLQSKLGFGDSWLVLAIVPVLLGAMGVRAIVLAWLMRRGVATWRREYLWLGSVAGVTLVPYYLMAAPRQVQFWTYFYVAAGVLAGLAFYDWWRIGFRVGRTFTAVLAVMLLCGVIDKPLDTAARNAYRLWKHRPVYNEVNRNLTAGLYSGLNWIRENTPKNAVIAVNEHYVDETKLDPRYFDYSAFSERRIFLEGWAYTVAAYRSGYADVITGKASAYPDRSELCSRVFEHGDEAAINLLIQEYGVTHLLVDRVHGHATPKLDALATRVFDHADVTIYQIKGKG